MLTRQLPPLSLRPARIQKIEARMTRTWQEITAEAAKETDPKKLTVLSAELDRALEERDKLLHKAVHTIDPSAKRKSA